MERARDAGFLMVSALLVYQVVQREDQMAASLIIQDLDTAIQQVTQTAANL